MKPVALYDLIPLKQPHVTSLLTLDSDFPGKQSSGFVNSVFVKSDKLVDISYSQYVPFVSKLTDNKDHSSPPSQTVGYEWNRNYEQVFSSSENTNPALLILPSKEDSSPNPIATIEQISQRISLKRKRAIVSFFSPFTYFKNLRFVHNLTFLTCSISSFYLFPSSFLIYIALVVRP